MASDPSAPLALRTWFVHPGRSGARRYYRAACAERAERSRGARADQMGDGQVLGRVRETESGERHSGGGERVS